MRRSASAGSLPVRASNSPVKSRLSRRATWSLVNISHPHVSTPIKPESHISVDRAKQESDTYDAPLSSSTLSLVESLLGVTTLPHNRLPAFYGAAAVGAISFRGEVAGVAKVCFKHAALSAP